MNLYGFVFLIRNQDPSNHLLDMCISSPKYVESDRYLAELSNDKSGMSIVKGMLQQTQ